MTNTKPVTLAAVIGAHGVAGEVRLKLFGEGVESLKGHKVLHAGETERTFTLKKVRDDNKGGAIARLAEVDSRSAAEKLRGTTLTVPRDALPPLAEGEYYHADLLGLAAVSSSGEALGEVIAVQNFGAGDVIEIQRPPQDGKPGKTFMVPMRVEAVPGWDADTITVSDDYKDQ